MVSLAVTNVEQISITLSCLFSFSKLYALENITEENICVRDTIEKACPKTFKIKHCK